jgi:Concanavalin A-like lectin/glucanases superfamily
MAGTTAGGTGTIVASGVNGGFGGNAIQITPTADANEVGGAPHILSTTSLSGVGITTSSAYTVMAWVNFSSSAGDNMIFGMVDGGVDALHHGSRAGNLHSGHWGDDLGPDQGINISTDNGVWHHIAYTNNSAGTQSIYRDGVLVASGATGTGGSMNTATTLAIGTSRNAGSFSGFLDEVRVYDTELTPAEITAALTVAPEPGTTALTGLLTVAALLGRRRRAAR